jgi:hypothetical protein
VKWGEVSVRNLFLFGGKNVTWVDFTVFSAWQVRNAIPKRRKFQAVQICYNIQLYVTEYLEYVWRPDLIAKSVNFLMRQGVFLKSVPFGTVEKSNDESSKKWPL